MKDLNVQVDLQSSTYTLSPTLEAMRKINGRFGSMVDASERVARLDFDAICFVIQAGSGLSGKRAEQMQREVVETGLVNVVASVSKFVTVLLNPEGREESEGEEQGEG